MKRIAMILYTSGIEYDDRVRKEILTVKQLFPDIEFEIFAILHENNSIHGDFVSDYGIKYHIPFLKTRGFYIPLFINIMILLGVEWLNRTELHGLAKMSDKRYIRHIVYYILLFIMIYAQPTSDATFIYFQF